MHWFFVTMVKITSRQSFQLCTSLYIPACRRLLYKIYQIYIWLNLTQSRYNHLMLIQLAKIQFWLILYNVRNNNLHSYFFSILLLASLCNSAFDFISSISALQNSSVNVTLSKHCWTFTDMVAFFLNAEKPKPKDRSCCAFCQGRRINFSWSMFNCG